VDPSPGQPAATYAAPCVHANQYTIADLRATSPDFPAASSAAPTAGDFNADPGPDLDAWTV
jgi:hypothetical protein